MSSTGADEWLLSFNQFQNTISRGKNDLGSGKKYAGKAKTISITSGKGGVGKTSISVKMGKMLAKTGHKVLVIDCDYNLSNTQVKLGLPITNSFYQLVNGEKRFEECIYRADNFHLLSGCNGNLDLFENDLELDKVVINLMVAIESQYDFIILDCPAGISKEVLTLNAYSDYRFIVASPDRSSITDSYSLIKILHSIYGINENHLLVNKISSEKQYKRIVKSLSETVENFLSCRLYVLGGVRFEETAVDLFDTLLLDEKKSDLHQDFSKVLKRFTEEILSTDEQVWDNMSHLPHASVLGQEVRPPL